VEQLEQSNSFLPNTEASEAQVRGAESFAASDGAQVGGEDSESTQVGVRRVL